MFIELAEYLQCPHPHEQTFLVLSTGAMRERHLLFGTIGCPVCHAEFPVLDGVGRFGDAPERTAPAFPPPSVEAVQAALGLMSPGGYVVLVGTAAELADALAPRLEGVHLVCVNAPGTSGFVATRSVVHAPDYIPLKPRVVRGAVLGPEYADAHWLAEGARVTLAGQRVVVLREDVTPPPGVAPLAAGQGLWVGVRR